jgi:hypothetical protein
VTGHERDHVRALDNLLLAWFHEDWQLDDDDSEDELQHVRDTDPNLASKAVREIDDLLSDGAASDAQLESLLHIGVTRDPRTPEPYAGGFSYAVGRSPNG